MNDAGEFEFEKPRKAWLLTAFEKKETSKPANSRMDVESNPMGKSDDTATRQNLNVSEGKGSEKPSDTQIIERAEAEEGDFGPIYTQFRGNAQGAIAKEQSGEATAALHHKDVEEMVANGLREKRNVRVKRQDDGH